MLRKKNGEATKFSTLDRSVASLEHTHSLSLPVAISLELPCYSYNLPVFILQQMQQPSECHCAAFAKFEQREKQNQETLLALIQCSAYHRYQEGVQVNLYGWEASSTIFH